MMAQDVFFVVLNALWLMLPAYIANPTAVVFGGGLPIDFGKNFMDGRRILGDGKTFRGLLGGTGCGMIIGGLQIAVAPMLPFPKHTIITVICFSFGALLGDVIKSFFKRRLGYERGGQFPVIDQLDFVAGAWLLTLIFASDWFFGNFTVGMIITVLIVTPFLHRVTNIIGYRVKIKKEPW